MQINGKKVVDPKRPILLQINDADVAGGRKKKPDACAAAKACVRQLGALSAKVHASRVYVEFPDKWIRLRTPIALRTEIVSFDRGHKFEAGEYNLIPLQPTIRLGKGNAGSGTGKPRRLYGLAARLLARPNAVYDKVDYRDSGSFSEVEATRHAGWKP